MGSSKVLQVYQKPFHYDDMGQFIFDANSKMVAQVRGWGDIKYQDDPAELQDAIGTEIVGLLNKIPDGKIETTVNMNSMRKSMVQNFNRIAGQLARENVKDQRLARYLEDLGERYTQQIASRLMETCRIVEFGGGDRRQVQRSIF